MSAPPPPPNLEPAAVLTLIASTLAGPTIAGVVGPYAVIIIASLVGASWALSEDKATTTWTAAWFLLRITATAALLTVGITAVLERYVFTTGAETRWLFAPVAFAIGWAGNDLPAAMRWFGRLLKRLAEIRFRGDGDGK